MRLDNRQWVLKERPQQRVEQRHFSLITSEVPELEEGEFLVKNHYLSFEPAQRGWLNDLPSYIPPVAIGEVMRAVGTGRVIASRHPEFPVDCLVQGGLGWQDYAVLDGKSTAFPVNPIPAGFAETHTLHLYGITGMTAYFGLLDIGQPKAGQTVLVSGAAGATGSIVGQLARIKGCRVIGIAGGPDKCRWLTEELGYYAAIDYRSENIAEALNDLCKNEIDIFFDNVGGEALEAALANLKMGARVVLCGGISSGYTATAPETGLKNYMQLVIRRCRMEGFLVLDYVHRFPEAAEQLKSWLDDGQLIIKEDIAEGLENCPDVLAGLFSGKNFGKQLLKI